MLPVQLAGRAKHFLPLIEASPLGQLAMLSPGARDAPRFSPGLTFMFTQWFEPSESDLLPFLGTASDTPVYVPSEVRMGSGASAVDSGPARPRESQALLSIGKILTEVQELARECHCEMQQMCSDLDGYVVEEIGLCEYLLAFPSPERAVHFAYLAQCGLIAAAKQKGALQRSGLTGLQPLCPSIENAPLPAADIDGATN